MERNVPSDYSSASLQNARPHPHQIDDVSGFIGARALPGEILRIAGLKTTYMTCYYAARFGVIPATSQGGRWFVLRRDLPRIVEILRKDAAAHSSIAA